MNTTEIAEIKLTEFSKGSGCGCKISPSELESILNNITQESIPGLLVGNDERDDAAVLKLDNGNCLISTTDFFTPIVNDAYDFGAIAATNAISDVYAMGGKPVLALGILGWPVNSLPAEMAAKVMKGAKDVCRAAGIPLAGGHSIDSPAPFFGLSVNGLVSEKDLHRNADAKEGDLLFLTKPLGLGMYATAHKRGLLSEEDYREMTGWMKKLNSLGDEVSSLKGVNAITDITGFGLLGHLIEMTTASKVSAEIELNAVPFLTRAKEFLSSFIYPDGTTRNWKSYSEKVKGVEGLEFIPLSDPQTSGGLLISVEPKYMSKYVDVARAHGIREDMLKPVGVVTAKRDHEVNVRA